MAKPKMFKIGQVGKLMHVKEGESKTTGAQ